MNTKKTITAIFILIIVGTHIAKVLADPVDEYIQALNEYHYYRVESTNQTLLLKSATAEDEILMLKLQLTSLSMETNRFCDKLSDLMEMNLREIDLPSALPLKKDVNYLVYERLLCLYEVIRSLLNWHSAFLDCLDSDDLTRAVLCEKAENIYRQFIIDENKLFSS